METSKNGELYLIDNEKMLYLTLQDIDNKFNDPNRIPEEDSIIAKKLYGDDEYKKKVVFSETMHIQEIYKNLWIFDYTR